MTKWSKRGLKNNLDVILCDYNYEILDISLKNSIYCRNILLKYYSLKCKLWLFMCL